MINTHHWKKKKNNNEKVQAVKIAMCETTVTFYFHWDEKWNVWMINTHHWKKEKNNNEKVQAVKIDAWTRQSRESIFGTELGLY